jgi:5-methylcytosine-specific restriction endonuclease McrA
MQVLILDQAFAPHRVVSWQRAVCMVFGGKVEVLDEYDEVVSSPSVAIRVPAVIRLLGVARRRPRVVRFSRFNVLLRDAFACQYCGEKPPPRELTVDHVTPRARGGASRWNNVVAACRPCNHKKGSRTPDEARMPLRRTPYEPKMLPSVGERLHVRGMPAQWAMWLRTG